MGITFDVHPVFTIDTSHAPLHRSAEEPQADHSHPPPSIHSTFMGRGMTCARLAVRHTHTPIRITRQYGFCCLFMQHMTTSPSTRSCLTHVKLMVIYLPSTDSSHSIYKCMYIARSAGATSRPGRTYSVMRCGMARCDRIALMHIDCVHTLQ